MQQSKIDGSSRLNAFQSVFKSIDSTAQLPSQVFGEGWAQFFFWESDKMFVPSFAEVAVELLHIEGSHSCCLLNFDLTREMQYESAAMLFLEGGTTGEEYASWLRKGDPSSAWLYDMHRYGCASDVGDWCIYCEKMNDLAVIAFRGHQGIQKFTGPLKSLRAHSIDEFLGMGPSAPLPFRQLVETWRIGLSQNYSSGPAGSEAGSPVMDPHKSECPIHPRSYRG